MTVHAGHNTEEIGCLSIEVFGDSIHFLFVQGTKVEVTLAFNDRVERVTETSNLQQALIYLYKKKKNKQKKSLNTCI